jgi:hypothetical protein
LKKTIIVLVVIIIGLQFVPVHRTNPPISWDINAPSKVSGILRTSCYDCHSNETRWPWYSYIAPVSYFITSDVNEGRKHLNFSEWDKYDEKKKAKKLDGIIEMVTEGEMPLPMYLLIHKNAKLDTEKINILKEWVKPGSSKEESFGIEKNKEKD